MTEYEEFVRLFKEAGVYFDADGANIDLVGIVMEFQNKHGMFEGFTDKKSGEFLQRTNEDILKMIEKNEWRT